MEFTAEEREEIRQAISARRDALMQEAGPNEIAIERCTTILNKLSEDEPQR